VYLIIHCDSSCLVSRCLKSQIKKSNRLTIHVISATGNWKEESGAFDDGFKESGGDKWDGGDAGAGVTDFGRGVTNGEANENGGGGAFTCRR